MRCLSQIQLNSNNSPFRFNAKELDCLSREDVRFGKETGNYYYGARYYDPKWSIWLSVDPLAEQAPEWTPYRFGFNNPINYYDPDGLWEARVNDDGSTSYIMEKGDDASTLASQYGLEQDVADRLFSKMEDGSISGQAVIDANPYGSNESSEVLKLDLNSKEGKDSQKRFDHFMYARDHSNSKEAFAFLSTDYFSNTKYKDMIEGIAKMKIDCLEEFDVYYNIPLYRSATFDRSSTAIGIANSPIRPKQTTGTSFPNQNNIELPIYHPETAGRMGDYTIFINGKNSNEAMSRLRKNFPEYRYHTLSNFKRD